MRFNENNEVILAGEIVSDFQFSYEVLGEGFYLFDLKVSRNSGNFDVLPVIVSERVVNVKESAIGATVKVEGQLRSYNKHIENRSHVILTMFTQKIENLEEGKEYKNRVKLRGFICKQPTYRQTPLGRDISDFTIAVNRPYGKSDYIPCIAWSRNAVFLSMQDVGTEIEIEGRFQSREYKKRIGEEEFEIRTAFEVSVSNLEVVNDECEY